MFRIAPIAFAVALLGACSTMDDMFSRNHSTSAGGTSTGAAASDTRTRDYYPRGDMASTPPAYGVNTPPSDPGSMFNAEPNSGCPNPGQGGDVKCQSRDPSGFR